MYLVFQITLPSEKEEKNSIITYEKDADDSCHFSC